MKAHYDKIGRTYAATRAPDPRIAVRILEALGDSVSVLNVGAGTGSYEPEDRNLVAIEPSAAMLSQRPPGAAPAVRGRAEELPFPDDSFDATMAVLTVHHWTDREAGLAEVRRVTRDRVVILTWEQHVWEKFWLIDEYFPIVREIDRTRSHDPAELARTLGGGQVSVVPVPHDCVDGFHGSFWRRPHAYLDPVVRAGISTYSLLPEDVINEGVARLADDLASGEWERRHSDLLTLDEIDLGYRLVVASMR